MDINQAKETLQRYANGQCSDEEKAWVETWYLTAGDNEAKISAKMVARAKNKVRNALPQSKFPVRTLWIRVAAAAIVIFICGLGYLLLSPKPLVKIIAGTKLNGGFQNRNMALLTLSNGKKITITSGNGYLASQGNAIIKKMPGGQVVYSLTKPDSNTQLVYNTIETPRGAQINIRLPDGTVAFLNAGSSLKYPVIFAGNKRVVLLSGEAYFEVAHDKTKPFHVKTRYQDAEVLGTHFDINAYDDENYISTTLLEGMVRVSGNEQSTVLLPGDQANTTTTASAQTINVSHNVNTDDVIAWKNGIFHFDHTDIHEVLRRYARWYDMDIVYNIPIHEKRYSGEFHKDLRIDQALELLNYTNVHFIIDGKKIIVSP